MGSYGEDQGIDPSVGRAGGGSGHLPIHGPGEGLAEHYGRGVEVGAWVRNAYCPDVEVEQPDDDHADPSRATV